MARHNRVRAWFRRKALVQRLGGKCVNCGAKGTKRNPLEIDHINGRTYDVRKMDPSWRIAQYEKEEREGVPLQVLCKKCNANAHKDRPEVPV